MGARKGFGVCVSPGLASSNASMMMNIILKVKSLMMNVINV